MNRRTRYERLYLTTALLALTAACGAPPQEEDTTGSAQLVGSLAQALSSSDVTAVRVTVSASDMSSRSEALIKSNNQWSGTLGKLPAGTGRTFAAEAFNSAGTKVYAGAATGITILARRRDLPVRGLHLRQWRRDVPREGGGSAGQRPELLLGRQIAISAWVWS